MYFKAHIIDIKQYEIKQYIWKNKVQLLTYESYKFKVLTIKFSKISIFFSSIQNYK